MAGLTLYDIGDRDLLYTLEEVANIEGKATAKEVADSMNLEHPNPTQCVGSRFGWLKKFGILESEIIDGGSNWKLTETGESLLHPKKGMTKAFESQIANLTEAGRVAITEMVSAQIAKDKGKMSRSAAHMSRRAWNHSMGNWRDHTIQPKRQKAAA